MSSKTLRSKDWKKRGLRDGLKPAELFHPVPQGVPAYTQKPGRLNLVVMRGLQGGKDHGFF